MSKILKRLGIFFLVLVVLIIGAAIAIPYFFKDEILAKVKTEANNVLNAELDFADVDLSLFRSFPDFSFAMEKLTVNGINEFQGINLVEVENLDFTLDLMSVIKSDRPIEIQSVTFDQPNINILVLKNGKANYDIVEPSEEEAEAYDFVIQLKKYAINEGNLTYDDRAGDIFLQIKNLNHNGNGDFTQDVFDLVTETSIDQLTASSGGIQYLRKAKTSLDAVFKIDLPNSTYTLADNELQINAMKLLADGFVQMPAGDDIMVDFTFEAPKNDFKNLLSLIPSAFTSDFGDVKADGKMAFDGFVKGTYNGVKGTLPAFKVNLDVDNGSFQYPDLPMGVDAITAKMKVESPSSNLDKMKIDIPSFKFALGGKPFEGRFKLTTPISDPNIDMKAKGTIDLADINKAFPMEGVSELSGIIDADVEAITRMSTIDRGDYENAKVSGNAGIKGLTYNAEGLPKIFIEDAQADFTPKQANIKNFSAKLGKSDIQASGNIDNILAYFSPEKTMTGSFTMTSKYFNADEWMTEEEAATVPTGEEEAVEIFDRFKFDIDAKVGKIDYDIYTLMNSSTQGSFSSKELKINQFATKIGESDLNGKGSLTKIFPYIFDNEILSGNLAINSTFFDLNPFMEETPTTGAKQMANEVEELEPIVIPDNIDVTVDAKINKLVYTNLDLKDFGGQLVVKDSKVKMENTSARLLGGKFEADGFYETTDPKKPQYDLTFDIKNFDYKSSFQKFVTIQKLAPIAEYIQGNFSSKMSFKGILGEDFMPDFTSLFADGFIQTTEGKLRGFEPLKKIGETLNIKKLKESAINLKGTKNWFEVKEGKVLVKEFPLKVEGIDMLIGGTHGITQDIDYNIKAKIPSKLIDQNAVGAAAKKGLAALNSQASKLGLNLSTGEFVNVLINLTGSITNPKVSFKLTGTDGTSVKDVVTQKFNEVKDSVTTKVKEVVDDKKEELEANIKAKREKLSAEADARIKRITDAANKSAEKVRAEGKSAAEKVRAEGYKQADALVEQAGNNVFKKKAAEIAAKKIRTETDKKAEQVMEKANQSGDKIIKEADDNAKKIRTEYQQKIDAVTLDNVGG